MPTPTQGSIPGPSGGDMLRSIGRIRRDPLGFLRDLSDRHGDVVAFPMPRRPALFVNHPDAVRHVLQANHRGYDRDTVQYRTLSTVTGGGLLTSDGPRWMRHRRLMQPAFHRGAVADLAVHVERAVAVCADSWDVKGADRPGGAVVDVDEAMMHTALDVVGRALFSTDLTHDADRLVQAVLTSLDQVVARAQNPLIPPPRVPTPGNLRLRAALRTLDGAVDRIVAARRAAEPVPDLLGMLLAVHDDAGHPFSTRELRDEVVTLIVAGHETVASALTWTWWLLSGDAEATRRLHEELDRVLDGRPPTVADVADLPFTRAVVDEALRLYPPAWLISRHALADDVVLGHDVPAGSLVFLSPWVVHRRDDVWDRPDEFRPERFLAGDASAADPARGAYVPFGAGPNLCIGRDLALVESVLAVATLAGRYRVERLPGHEAAASALVTIRPRGGLPMRVTVRQG
jgi:cytochrome P450